MSFLKKLFLYFIYEGFQGLVTASIYQCKRRQVK
jgi:hypothetical protein